MLRICVRSWIKVEHISLLNVSFIRLLNCAGFQLSFTVGHLLAVLFTYDCTLLLVIEKAPQGRSCGGQGRVGWLGAGGLRGGIGEGITDEVTRMKVDGGEDRSPDQAANLLVWETLALKHTIDPLPSPPLALCDHSPISLYLK